MNNHQKIIDTFNANEREIDLIFKNVEMNPHISMNHALFVFLSVENVIIRFKSYFDKQGNSYNATIKDLCLLIALCKYHNKYVKEVGMVLKEYNLL